MQTGPHPVSPTCDKRLERFWMDSPFPQIQKQSACQFLWTVDRTVRWSAAQESLTSHASLMIDAGHSCGIVELDSDWVTIQSSTEGTTKSPRVSECWLECGFSTNDQVHYTDCSELLAIPSGIWSELEPWKSLSRKLYRILLDLLRQETGRDERIFLTSKVEDLLATIGVFLSGEESPVTAVISLIYLSNEGPTRHLPSSHSRHFLHGISAEQLLSQRMHIWIQWRLILDIW